MHHRSIWWGSAGSLLMGAFYAGVLAWGSGVSHVGQQFRSDWFYVVPITVGFGVQIALIVELRRRHRLHRPESASGAVGAGSAAAGMVACCAHHVADVVPFAIAAGAAGFLSSFRVPFMVLGITLNAIGISVALRRLLRTTSPIHPVVGKDPTCVPV